MSRPRPYRFGFVLATTIGLMTRYLTLRKYAELDDEVECTWAPVNHYTPPEHPSRLRFLPDPLFMRARVLQQAMPVMRQLQRFDAVMIHLFEADVLTALRSYLRRTPVRISSTDEAPMTDWRNYPLYPNHAGKPRWRQQMRSSIDRWLVRRTDCFIPVSQWVADVLTAGCGAPPARVHPIHVGLDLDLWKSEPRPARPRGEKTRILFVGTDFARKGGPLLVDVFRNRFQGEAELHLVSTQAPRELPPGVHVHANLRPNDGRLAELYAQADIFVLPSTADMLPWVYLEAMAMRLPVIGTDTGASREVVRHGVTGLMVKSGDGEALAAAIRMLADNPELRREMGERGRALVEADYSARVNVPRILRTMKEAVDARLR